MRIRVVQTPTRREIDGVSLQRFIVGMEYDVGVSLGTFLLVEGWAELVAPPRDANADPPNLTREIDPPSFRERAADFRRKP